MQPAGLTTIETNLSVMTDSEFDAWLESGFENSSIDTVFISDGSQSISNSELDASLGLTSDKSSVEMEFTEGQVLPESEVDSLPDVVHSISQGMTGRLSLGSRTAIESLTAFADTIEIATLDMNGETTFQQDPIRPITEPQLHSTNISSPADEQGSEHHMKLKVKSLRWDLQKGFLPKEGPPKAEEMAKMSLCLAELEGIKFYSQDVLHSTRICTALKIINRLESIPRDEEFSFRKRITDLLEILRAKRKEASENVKVPVGEPAKGSQVMLADVEASQVHPTQQPKDRGSKETAIGLMSEGREMTSSAVPIAETVPKSTCRRQRNPAPTRQKKRKHSDLAKEMKGSNRDSRIKKHARLTPISRRSLRRTTSPRQLLIYENRLLSQSMERLNRMLAEADEAINVIEERKNRMLEENALEIEAALRAKETWWSCSATSLIGKSKKIWFAANGEHYPRNSSQSW